MNNSVSSHKILVCEFPKEASVFLGLIEAIILALWRLWAFFPDECFIIFLMCELIWYERIRYGGVRVLSLSLLESCLGVTDVLASLRANENFRRWIFYACCCLRIITEWYWLYMSDLHYSTNQCIVDCVWLAWLYDWCIWVIGVVLPMLWLMTSYGLPSSFVWLAANDYFRRWEFWRRYFVWRRLKYLYAKYLGVMTRFFPAIMI